MEDISINNSLSELSRRERKYLLMTSAIGVFVSWAGVVPTKISALGIELNSSEQKAFLLMLACIVTYFLLAFVIYGFKDFIEWRITYHSHRRNQTRKHLIAIHEFEEQDHPDGLEQEVDKRLKHIRWPHRAKRPVIWLNIFFEFAFPILVSLFSIASLVTYG
jgi:hypothetical protein